MACEYRNRCILLEELTQVYGKDISKFAEKYCDLKRCSYEIERNKANKLVVIAKNLADLVEVMNSQK